eukprot:6023580-Amphidinium_carterae.1
MRPYQSKLVLQEVIHDQLLTNSNTSSGISLCGSMEIRLRQLDGHSHAQSGGAFRHYRMNHH